MRPALLAQDRSRGDAFWRSLRFLPQLPLGEGCTRVAAAKRGRSVLRAFAGLLVVYWASRAHYPRAFEEAVVHNDLWLGTINTGILLTSSFLVALAVSAARAGRGASTAYLLWGAAALGAVFLAIKAYEYGSPSTRAPCREAAPASTLTSHLPSFCSSRSTT